jgi:protein-tyrosine-phosphatase
MNVDMLYPALKSLIVELEKEFPMIRADRLPILDKLTSYIASGQKRNEAINLIFICTHNSRRSHLSQIWAQTAAYVYGIENVFCYSGGTEATAFNARAVRAMEAAGFRISIEKDGMNPTYLVNFAEESPPVRVFSKVYDDDVNPKRDFAAVMTCSHADHNCPFIPGADLRIPLTYDDPKDFDGTPLEEEKYRERVREIGREMLYVFEKAESLKT